MGFLLPDLHSICSAFFHFTGAEANVTKVVASLKSSTALEYRVNLEGLERRKARAFKTINRRRFVYHARGRISFEMENRQNSM